jgi:hypothetical protein
MGYRNRPRRRPRSLVGRGSKTRQAAGTVCCRTMARLRINAASPSRGFNAANRLAVSLPFRLELLREDKRRLDFVLEPRPPVRGRSSRRGVYLLALKLITDH